MVLKLSSERTTTHCFGCAGESSFNNVTSSVLQGSIVSLYLFACEIGSSVAAKDESRMIKNANNVAIAHHTTPSIASVKN